MDISLEIVLRLSKVAFYRLCFVSLTLYDQEKIQTSTAFVCP